ncbi:MAG: hypothetical protein N2C12_18775 [Planctomycetales bacterium]
MKKPNVCALLEVIRVWRKFTEKDLRQLSQVLSFQVAEAGIGLARSRHGTLVIRYPES